MPEKPRLEDFTDEAEYRAAVEAYELESKKEPNLPPLPDGFDPSLYGFVPKADHDKAVKEREEFEKRYNDTRTQFNNERTTVHQRLDELSQRVDGRYSHQVGPQPKSVAQTLAAYQANPSSLEAYNEYMLALNREAMQPQLDAIRKEFQAVAQQQSMNMQRMAFMSNPQHVGVRPEEIEQEFLQTPATLDEGYFVMLARKAGGTQKFLEQVRAEGEQRFLADIKSGKKKLEKIPAGIPPKRESRSGEPDWERMTDAEVLAMGQEKT